MTFIHAVTTLPAWWMTALGSPRRSPSDRVRSRLLHEFRSATTHCRTPGGLAFLEASSVIARTLPCRLIPALTSALAEAPAVALLGPRQVGKTTLALELANTRPAVHLDLESCAN